MLLLLLPSERVGVIVRMGVIDGVLIITVATAVGAMVTKGSIGVLLQAQ